MIRAKTIMWQNNKRISAKVRASRGFPQGSKACARIWRRDFFWHVAFEVPLKHLKVEEEEETIMIWMMKMVVQQQYMIWFFPSWSWYNVLGDETYFWGLVSTTRLRMNTFWKNGAVSGVGPYEVWCSQSFRAKKIVKMGFNGWVGWKGEESILMVKCGKKR